MPCNIMPSRQSITRTTNKLERVNRKIRRLERVVSIFPNNQSSCARATCLSLAMPIPTINVDGVICDNLWFWL